MRKEYRSGLVRYGKYLAYGVDHGFGQWIPYPVQSFIVGTWNRIACLTGHSDLVQDAPDKLPECTCCCRPVRKPKTKPIKSWED